jgi:hypothetical protein
MNHCQFILTYNMAGEGEPVFCDRPATIKWDRVWLCADHYDLCEREAVYYWGDGAGVLSAEIQRGLGD